MSLKLTCPSCGRYLSSIFRAYEEGLPCPQCGASLSAASEQFYQELSGSELPANIKASVTRSVPPDEIPDNSAERLLYEIFAEVPGPDACECGMPTECQAERRGANDV